MLQSARQKKLKWPGTSALVDKDNRHNSEEEEGFLLAEEDGSMQ